ncbi:glycosyltransferase [Geotalea uraniireducens]|uniref:Glycosyl transferase, group 1 n=1 Tax=Geotalea uraniireducens (strain Rf4) TaxID=351605 RepID=A5G3Z0_GEOUR|nr:glycosyltransferase [Geotalea uraniireducens]ABQ26508.1 glycosyl transferase, group 1 [Geotalea uraniireducens Rf4]
MNATAFPKMKVFHFISGDLWAGAETMAFNLLRRLKGYSDLDLSVILLNEGRLADELRNSGLTVHVIDERRYSFWEIVRRIRAILRSSPPQLIHSHRYKENILAILAAGPGGSINLIATQHGLPEFAGKKPPFAVRFKSRANFHILSRYFTKTVAVSGDVRNFLVNHCAFRKENVEVIHNGIEIPNAMPPKGGIGLFVIGSSGRLFQVKDYPLMVDIARTIADLDEDNIRFELAGDGPERSTLEALVQRYELRNRFVLKGHQDDMDTFYRGLDLYLNTSVHEGIPMTILEALARGLPVIAPAVGGICEIIENGVEGFLINGRHPHDFAEKCLLLRENKELRERMSKSARYKVEQLFSAERMAESYYRLYCRTSRPSRFGCLNNSASISRAS